MRALSAAAAMLLTLLSAQATLADNAAPSSDVVDMSNGAPPTDSVVPPKWFEKSTYPRVVAGGKAAATLVVAEDGSVRDIVIVESSGRESFDSTFTNFLASQRFAPGSRGGKPIAVRIKATAVGVSDWSTGHVMVTISAYSKDGTDCLTAAPQIVAASCTVLITHGYDSVSSRISRARAYVVLGRDDEALADLAAAKGMNARGGEISRLQGFIYEKRGDYQKAIDNYGDAIEGLESAIALLDRGLAYEMLGRTELAAADFKKAANLSPECGKPACKSSVDAQIAMLDQRIAQNPNDIVAFANRCIQRSLSGQQLTIALADCNHVLASMPNEPNTLEARGLIFLRMSTAADALHDFDAVLALTPQRTVSIYLRGLAKLRSGDIAGAHTDLIAARSAQTAIAVNMAAIGVLPR